MKHQALFYLKDKKKIKVSSAAILLGSIRVNWTYLEQLSSSASEQQQFSTRYVVDLKSL